MRSQEALIERFFEALVNGDRPAARAIVVEASEGNAPAHALITDLFWPTYEMVERLFRNDQLTTLSYHFATRLLRVLTDQASQRLRLAGHSNGRTVLALSGPSDSDDLGAQMAVDLLESAGFQVTFAGGGVPSDEVMSYVNNNQPDVLLMFASAPSDLPEIRAVIDSLNEIGAARRTQIVVGGGVFNRAEGLAEEIGADLWAVNPLDLVDAMVHESDRRAEKPQRLVTQKRRYRDAA
jgi:methanogenic corrinoid protein MtbC1